MKIGVFDSGVGGLGVANAIQAALPDQTVILRQDSRHIPYGTRQPAEIFSFVVPIFEELIGLGCPIIVVACNTVSTTLIKRLRAKFPATQLIAMEPMVKPAAELTKSGIIAVCATPTTLASTRYQWLKDTYAANVTVLEPNCSDWAAMIERKQIDEYTIAERVKAVLAGGADVIVLGCTHYHWIEFDIKVMAAGKAEIIQPEAAVIAQLQRLLAANNTKTV